MDILSYTFLFLFGTIIGSFLNVVILRYEPGGRFLGRQLLGRSHCPKCGKTLKWYELIPIASFALQLGRCRGCGTPISSQYPIIEILGGFIVLTTSMIIAPGWLAAMWAAAFFILLAASVIDLKHYVIPDAATIMIALIGVGMTAVEHLGFTKELAVIPGSFLGGYAYIFSFTENIIIGHIAAALVLGGVFSAIILGTRGKAMGWGDAKLAAAIGLLLGWPDSILAIMLAFIIGAIIGISMMISKKKKMKDALPFGPFIAIGVALVFYFGYQIMVAYFKLLNIGI
ncbi:MAG: prepilin peptidase [Candidatus Colwellbacteria bacterium]|nr:prepilin peptidase [Candidatus Colwellbacteria bacterium]